MGKIRAVEFISCSLCFTVFSLDLAEQIIPKAKARQAKAQAKINTVL